jgi:hypothetical protein
MKTQILTDEQFTSPENQNRDNAIIGYRSIETETKPLNIADVRESCLAKCDVCKCHPNVIIRTKFGTFCQAHARYV